MNGVVSIVLEDIVLGLLNVCFREAYIYRAGGLVRSWPSSVFLSAHTVF